MNSHTIPGRALAVMVLLAVCSSAQAAGWWNPEWLYRRVVTVSGLRPTHLAGDDVAVVTMPTGGLTRPDGGDIRVISSSDKEMPCRVLMVGPGDQVRVAFALQGGADRYYIYFGHPNPPPRQGELAIQRGVLLEMWGYPGGGMRTLNEVKAILDKPGPLIGRDFRDRIFLGYNPFGPESRIASVFTGYVNCVKEGEYVFAISSQNASFLLVDDTMVVDNGGTHPPQNDVRMQGKATLKAGLHKLTFYHVSGAGDPVAVAAWKPPGEDRILPIPADAFTPVPRAAAGAIEKYAADLAVDFIPEQAGESFLLDRYFQRYMFRALMSGRGGKVQWEWNFGDGQVSGNPDVQHVYLVSGEYTVTLTAKTFAGEMKRTNRIFVARQWDRVTENRLDGLKSQGEIVADYNFAALSTEANAQAVVLLKRADLGAAMIKAGEAFVARPAAEADSIQEVLPLYAKALIEAGKASAAADALVKASAMCQNPAVCAAMVVQAGRTCLDCQDDTKRALELFENAVKQYESRTTGPAIRQARIGIGDVWRARGDVAKATAAYGAARAKTDASAAKMAIQRGDLARHVEEYLRTKEWPAAEEYLTQWEEAFPLDKLEGCWSLLRVQLLLAQGRAAEAAKEAETLVNVNPSSNYAANILMASVQAYEKLKQPDKAKAAMKSVAEKYPESPRAAEAAQRLKDGK